MMQSQPQQQKKDSPEKGPQWSENTLFLCPDDEFEYPIAKAYLEKTYPGSGATSRMFTELPLDKGLNGQHTIIALYRPPGRSEAFKTVIDQGHEHPEKVKPAALAHEVVEGAPIRVKDFWSDRPASLPRTGLAFGGAAAGGSINVRGICAALSETLDGAVVIQPSGIARRMLKIGT